MEDTQENGSIGEDEKKEDKYWLEIETPAERKSRIRSLYIVHLAMLVFNLGYSIILTGVLPYLRRLTGMEEEKLLGLFGWVVAINPIGQMIFSPFLGWLTTKMGSIRIVMLVSCVIYMIGNLIYSCLSVLPEENEGAWRWSMMLVGRLLVGISTANQACIRAYIAGATFRHERNGQIAMNSLFLTVGFAIGPAVQAALTPIGCSEEYKEGELRFDMYTVSGWLSCVIGLISLISFMPRVFQESYVADKEAEYLNKKGNNEKDVAHIRPDLIAVGTCMFGFFMFMFNYILLETIGTPLCMQQLGWDETKSIRNLGILMAAGAVVSLIVFATIGPLTKKIDERLIYVIAGILPMLVGRVVMIPMGADPPKMKPHDPPGFDLRNVDCSEEGGEGGCDLEWCEYTPAITEVQFYLGYIIAALSFPYCMGISQAIFSKAIGPRPQGLWMGLLTATGSLARICGPIFVSYIYELWGTYWTMGICSVTLFAPMVLSIVFYKRLIPIETRLALEAEEETDKDTSL